MRIDNFLQVQQLYNATNTKNTKKTDSKSASFADQVQISKAGKDIQTVKTALNQTDDIRKDKVTPLKESIEAGTYDVSDEDLVDKLLSKFTL